MQKYVPISSASIRKLAGLLSIALVLMYLLDNFWLASWVGSFASNYVIRPILWLIIAGLVYKAFPAVKPDAKLRLKSFLIQMAIISGIIIILANVAGGLIDGFGNSPYDLSFKGIVINLIYIGSFIVGVEYCRAWLLNSVFKQKRLWGMVLITLAITLFWFPYSKLMGLSYGMSMVTFLGTILFPALAENALLCYLAILGGPIPAIIVQGILKIFHWCFPILPNMQWITATLIGTFIPILCLILVQQSYLTEAKKAEKIWEQEDAKGSFVLSVAVIMLVWFSVGVFSIYPSVIISGSMYPAINVGDMIIVKKSDPNQMKMGDIIQFEIENKIRVVHRIIDINEENGQRFFITKGDNNSTPDSDPVSVEQIKGNVVAILPKVGWVTIAIRTNSQEMFIQNAEKINSGGESGE